MRVSVITPVYNAAEFVTRAVESALAQPEVAEVLLIEDGSPDGSLAICQALAEQHDRVKLLRHPGGANRGAGASRNLGMRNASCEYIAFLDADDYYLPGRFRQARQVFDSEPECDGVYEAIGRHVEDRAGQRRWEQAGKNDDNLQTLTKVVNPKSLADELLAGQIGSFSIDGLVLKAKILEKSGWMDESLRLHQDTEFILRLAIVGILLPGILNEPVAMWRVHSQNRISSPRTVRRKLDDKLEMWGIFYRWMRKNGYAQYRGQIMKKMLINIISEKRFGKFKITLLRKVFRFWYLLSGLVKQPEYLIDKVFYKELSQLLFH